MLSSNYNFNNLNEQILHRSSHINDDVTDQSQRNMQNMHYTSLNLTNYFDSQLQPDHINFVTKNPGLEYSGLIGPGLGPTSVDNENKLLWGTEIERPLEKLQLFTRPFLTVPYLGRGWGDPTLESQLQQGDYVNNKKSTSTVPEENMDMPNTFPLIQSNKIEEIALGGWNRGGVDTRITGDEYFSKNRFVPN
jgi:hypothetical protein